MAIIYLTQPLRQSLQGLTAQPPECPADPSHQLVRNGTFQRYALTAQGTVRVRIQRFLCRTCQCTYSALPYDCQPYTAWTWPIMLAILVWRHRGWSLARCLAWRDVDALGGPVAVSGSSGRSASAPVDCGDLGHAPRGGLASRGLVSHRALASVVARGGSGASGG